MTLLFFFFFCFYVFNCDDTNINYSRVTFLFSCFHMHGFRKLVFLQTLDFHGFHKFLFHWRYQSWINRLCAGWPIFFDYIHLWSLVIINILIIIIIPQPHPMLLQVLHWADIVDLVVICQQTKTFSPDLQWWWWSWRWWWWWWWWWWFWWWHWWLVRG